eukprot:COSAG05_NODE_18199_length_312_cov_0.727700_1_plen_56_part_01
MPSPLLVDGDSLYRVWHQHASEKGDKQKTQVGRLCVRTCVCAQYSEELHSPRFPIT